MSRADDGGPNPVPPTMGTVTFLLTDVEGLSGGGTELAVATTEALERYRAIVAEAVIGCGGTDVSDSVPSATIGAFTRATDAVAAAVAAQRSLVDQVWSVPGGIQVRMAIHTGEANARDDNAAFESTLDHAAHLRRCGRGGQVLLSQTTGGLVAGRLSPGVTVLDLGRHRLYAGHLGEQVWQLVVAGMRSTFPRLASLDSMRHNLPVRLTPLIGREAEIAELTSALARERIITLTGSGGCGKSRLSIELAGRVLDRYAGGVAWVELAPCSDFDSVVGTIATTLDVVELAGEKLLDRVVRTLGVRPAVLLVLDNAEHVIGAVADTIATLLAGAPEVSVVTTSREPVGTPGELIWRVPSLSAPRPEQTVDVSAHDLDVFDAVQLFVDRAARARRDFAVTDANAAAVAQICCRLDGMPLAIELAAARVRTMPPERIAAQLDDRFRLLAGGPRTLVARQQTLQASVAWSESLLTQAEQVVFRRLGVFTGGFTVEAAESVIGRFGDVDSYEVADVVVRLVDKCLVQLDEVHGRYSLLETIRSYALQRLLETGETGQARDAHAEWCADWLESFPNGDGAADVNAWWTGRLGIVGRVTPEWPNCAGALDWARPGTVLSLRLVAGLGDFWALRQGAVDSARYGMPAVLAADRERPEWLTAILRLQAVRTNALDGEFALLRDEAIRRATERGDRRAVLCLDVARLITMAMIVGPRDDVLAELSSVCEEALGIREWYTAWNAMQSPAVNLVSAGRLVDAEHLVARLTSSRALLIRSTIAQMRGDMSRSTELAAEAEQLVDSKLGATIDRLLVAFRAASAALAMNDRAALDSIGDADSGLESLPRSFYSAHALVRGVGALLDQRLEDARDAFAAVPIELFPSWQSLGYLAQIELALGNRDAARAAAVQLRTASNELSAPLFESTSDLVLAECDRADDLGGALDQAHRALAAAVPNELWPTAVDALEAIGAMLIDAGRTRDAARLLAAAQSARTAMRYRHRFAHRAAYVAAAHDAVRGHEGWDEGAALTLVDAIAIAQRMRGERMRPVIGWDSLTPTERQVAEQVAEGLTNPQIAERLLMSRATVKTHLVHIYAKLGFASRAELAAAIARRGGS